MTQAVVARASHRISGVESSARTGICSICGPVKVYGNQIGTSKESWRCAINSAASALLRSKRPEVDDAYRNARFLREYGITLAQYDQMVEDQQGVCARCEQTPKVLRLAVDHCHKTGAVRKLLCGPCNTYLGRLEANRERLAEDLAYLETGDFAAVIAKNLA